MKGEEGNGEITVRSSTQVSLLLQPAAISQELDWLFHVMQASF